MNPIMQLIQTLMQRMQGPNAMPPGQMAPTALPGPSGESNLPPLNQGGMLGDVYGPGNDRYINAVMEGGGDSDTPYFSDPYAGAAPNDMSGADVAAAQDRMFERFKVPTADAGPAMKAQMLPQMLMQMVTRNVRGPEENQPKPRRPRGGNQMTPPGEGGVPYPSPSKRATGPNVGGKNRPKANRPKSQDTFPGEGGTKSKRAFGPVKSKLKTKKRSDSDKQNKPGEGGIPAKKKKRSTEEEILEGKE